MKKMKMLAFLNLKGCTSLESLPEMNLISLKTLTLSGCSTFKEFPLISDNIETLYLDGTAISQLPMNMEKLQRLVVLNMKDCKMLEEIPGRVGELKALQELILSDCLNLKIFPEIDISFLNILLLDGTAIEVMPQLPSVQYLCLSRNAKISCLPVGISQLSQLKWLDLKYCTSLTSVPEFPPNLQCLDAHGCSSLKTVSKPLARIMPTEQNHSTFIFTNCENLEQAAKEEITSYAQRKCQLLSYARKRYNGVSLYTYIYRFASLSVSLSQIFAFQRNSAILRFYLFELCRVLFQNLCSALAFLDVKCLLGFVMKQLDLS